MSRRNEAQMSLTKQTSPKSSAKPHKRVGNASGVTGRHDDSADVTTRLPRIGENGKVADPLGRPARAGSNAFSLPRISRRAGSKKEPAARQKPGEKDAASEKAAAPANVAPEKAAPAKSSGEGPGAAGQARGSGKATGGAGERAVRVARPAASAPARGEDASGGEGEAPERDWEAESEARRRSRAEKPARRSPGEVAGAVVGSVRNGGAAAVGFVRRHPRALIGVAIAIALVASVWGPLGDYYVAWRRSGDLQEEYAEVSSDNEALSEDVDRLQSRQGIEDEARRQGYAYEGENTATTEGVEEDDPNQGSDPTTDQPEEEESLAWYIVVLDKLFGYQS